MSLGTAAGGLLAAPLAAEAQQAKKGWRIGHLDYAYPTRVSNLVIESRVSDSSFERLHGLAAELVGLKVDLIAASARW